MQADYRNQSSGSRVLNAASDKNLNPKHENSKYTLVRELSHPVIPKTPASIPNMGVGGATCRSIKQGKEREAKDSTENIKPSATLTSPAAPQHAHPIHQTWLDEAKQPLRSWALRLQDKLPCQSDLPSVQRTAGRMESFSYITYFSENPQENLSSTVQLSFSKLLWAQSQCYI